MKIIKVEFSDGRNGFVTEADQGNCVMDDDSVVSLDVLGELPSEIYETGRNQYLMKVKAPFSQVRN